MSNGNIVIFNMYKRTAVKELGETIEVTKLRSFYYFMTYHKMLNVIWKEKKIVIIKKSF